MKSIMRKYILLMLVVASFGVSIRGAPRTLKIIQVYATAETANSVEVVWNTTSAADSLLQYSNINPVPASAPQVYSANQTTLHEIELTGLTPGTLYFYKVTSCTKKGCVSASGTFETLPSCPDVVPPVSGSWQQA
jgi:phosphodiesterase/alkaline phosphatase D-like protein